MSTIETILKQLVRAHEFVIIPEFGALLSHQVVAHFDKKQGRFIPSSRKLSFNEFVSQDDGFLANYISKTEGITHQQALTNIRNFVLEQKSRLKQSGETEILDIGTFRENIEGKLVFEPNRQQYIQEDWYGFSPIDAQESGVKAINMVANTIDEAEYVAQDELPTHGAMKWYHWASAAMLIGVLCYFSFFLVGENTLLNKSDLNPFTSSVREEISAPEEESASVNMVAVDLPKGNLTDVTSEPPVPVSDNVEEDIPVREEINAQGVIESDPFEYYLIAGVFRGEKQAGVLVEELREKGYPLTKIIPRDRNSSNYKVAVQGFVDKASATAANRHLKSIIGEYGWVYHKR
ncbi:HU domain-containing protein [Dyadobacter tibetensis]|uniref:HU domain-containing protein n=1 Tax=Dyadobacter tibetensis TaxID=1211851 RepID=UPI00046FA8C7|nr:SPOR domain-containing protein [Dyadobacter tibetensis]